MSAPRRFPQNHSSCTALLFIGTALLLWAFRIAAAPVQLCSWTQLRKILLLFLDCITQLSDWLRLFLDCLLSFLDWKSLLALANVSSKTIACNFHDYFLTDYNFVWLITIISWLITIILWSITIMLALMPTDYYNFLTDHHCYCLIDSYYALTKNNPH
jgi:hypothetical protein